MTDFSNLMSSLFNLLQNWTTALLAYLYNIVIDSIQVVFDYCVTFALYVVSLFPTGAAVPTFGEPVPTATNAAWPAFLNAVNWFFPVGYFVTLLTAFAAAAVAYFVIAPLARWVKLLT
jgi:hypothetical protein